MSYFRPLSGLFSAVPQSLTQMQQQATTARQTTINNFTAKYGTDPHFADYLTGLMAVLNANVPASFDEVVSAVNKALSAGQPAAAAPAILSTPAPGTAPGGGGGAPPAAGGMSRVVLYGAAAAVGLGVLLVLKRKKA